jgi:hypothetical protein
MRLDVLHRGASTRGRDLNARATSADGALVIRAQARHLRFPIAHVRSQMINLNYSIA